MDNHVFLRGQRKGQAFVLLAVTVVWLYVLWLFFLMSHQLILTIRQENIPITLLNGFYLTLFYATPFSIPVSICLMWFYFFKRKIWDGLLWGVVPLVMLILSLTTFYLLSSIA